MASSFSSESSSRAISINQLHHEPHPLARAGRKARRGAGRGDSDALLINRRNAPFRRARAHPSRHRATHPRDLRAARNARTARGRRARARAPRVRHLWPPSRRTGCYPVHGLRGRRWRTHRICEHRPRCCRAVSEKFPSSRRAVAAPLPRCRRAVAAQMPRGRRADAAQSPRSRRVVAAQFATLAPRRPAPEQPPRSRRAHPAAARRDHRNFRVRHYLPHEWSRAALRALQIT